MSDTPEAAPAPPQSPLDAHGGGAFPAARPGERPDASGHDPQQEKIVAHWGELAQALLGATPFDMARAQAWQRDAAKARAPLSREPLAHWRAQLAARIHAVKDVQHQAQVQREAALLLAQRIEVLSTKPWREALAALDALRADIQRWQAQLGALQTNPCWPSVQSDLPAHMHAASARLSAVWEAFEATLQQTQTAAHDNTAPLPSLPVWADELRAARGLPPQNILHSTAAVAEPPAHNAAHNASASHDSRDALAEHPMHAPGLAQAREPKARRPLAERAAAASAAIVQALQQFQSALETAATQPQIIRSALQTLRTTIRTHGRLVDDALAAQVHAAMLAAGDAHGWPRHNANTLRQDLLDQAQALLAPPEGQTFVGGHKLQEALRQLRAQWQLADLGNPPNVAVWKKFDQACSAIHQQVQAWHDRQRQQAVQAKAQRLALIEEINAWADTHANIDAGNQDWRASARSLRQFGERWRACGHVGEKLYAELHPQFRHAMTRAGAPLQAAQQASTARRQTLIEEAATLAARPRLDVAGVRALQQRWQAEAQAVPLPRMQEQKMWEAFRQPLDQAFQQKDQHRLAHHSARHAVPTAELTAHERRVLEASTALQAASATGEAQNIHAAISALQAALRGHSDPAAAATPSDSTAPKNPHQDPQPPAAADPAAAATTAPARQVVAVRGDDRPGAQKNQAPSPAPAERSRRYEPRPPRGAIERPERGPRLAEPVFRAQREALEQAQHTLRRLAVQTHGEALTQILAAWQARDAAQLPSAQQLGSGINATARSAWLQTLARAPASDGADADQALLRLEMAADLPTPAEHLEARRALQLQLLTRRNDPPPAQTWTQDTARVLACPHTEAQARRLRNALKLLLR